MPSPRDVLNAVKWRDAALDEVEIWYVHRGAPHDTRIVRGDAVVALHHSFMELKSPEGTTMIPYHRVFRIARGERAIWERGARAAGDDESGPPRGGPRDAPRDAPPDPPPDDGHAGP